jgi:signal transduction histidine kinase
VTLLAGAALVVVGLLALGWWLSWVATRLDRAHARVERTWGALDLALLRRAQGAVEVVNSTSVDPATRLLVSDAAGDALEDNLPQAARERAESNLSQVLTLAVLPEVGPAQERVRLARRLHNDAVVTAQILRRRPLVRLFRLAGHAQEPDPFEMSEN